MDVFCVNLESVTTPSIAKVKLFPHLNKYANKKKQVFRVNLLTNKPALPPASIYS